MQGAPAYKHKTQPVDLIVRIITRLLQNLNASQTEFGEDFGLDAGTGSEKEDILKAAEHLVSLSRDNGISVLFYYRVLKLKFEKEKNNNKKPHPNKQTKNNPREKNLTIASSSKGFTDPNQFFCCCGKVTSFTEYFKIFRLHLLRKKSCIWKPFLKCLQSPPCKSGRWVSLDLKTVAKFPDLTGQSVFLRSRGTRCTQGRVQGRGSQESFMSRSWQQLTAHWAAQRPVRDAPQGCEHCENSWCWSLVSFLPCFQVWITPE